MSATIEFPFGETLSGPLYNLAADIRIIPVPTPLKIGDVNAIAVREVSGAYKGGWTLIDPGPNITIAYEAWQTHLTEVLEGLPVKRVLVTHFHADHIGLAGWFCKRFKAELWTPRTSWLSACLLQTQSSDTDRQNMDRFLKRSGFKRSMLDAYHGRDRGPEKACSESLPTWFCPLFDGQQLKIGERDWEVLFGHGHAPDHAVLIDRKSNLVIAADQVLPMITPNVGVPPSELDSDPLGAWQDSCVRFSKELDDSMLIVPGHGAPFRGARKRLETIGQAQDKALSRIESFVDGPRTTLECFEALYRRQLDPAKDVGPLAQTLALLNRLRANGTISAITRPDGVMLWSAAR